MMPENPQFQGVNTLTCEQCETLLPLYAATGSIGQSAPISPDVQQAIERHVASCARCQVSLDEWRLVAQVTRAAANTLPADTGTVQGWNALRSRLGNVSPQARQATHANHHARLLSTKEIVDMDTVDNETKPIPTSDDEFAREPIDGRRVDRRSSAPPSARRNRWRSFVAVGSLVALVALSLTLFNVFAARLRNHIGSGACDPSSYRVVMPRLGSLNAVAPLGNDDGWAVGWVREPGLFAVHTLIMRLHNCAWQPVGSNVAPTIENAQLTAISMGSANDGWALGSELTYNPATGFLENGPYIALHYHNGVWSRASLPVNHAAGTGSLSMTSPANGWALFGYIKSLPDKPGALPQRVSILLHYNGRAWAPVSLPFVQSTTILDGLAAIPNGDCWIVGYDTVHNGTDVLIAHYHAGKWSITRSSGIGGIGPNTPIVVVEGVSFISQTEGYVSGYACSNRYQSCHGLILRYDGAHWKTETLPAISSQYAWHLTGITALAPGSAWAFGDQAPEMSADPTTSEVILSSYKGVWHRDAAPTNVQAVYGLTVYSQTQGWALAISRSQPIPLVNLTTSPIEPIFYDEGVWSTPPVSYV